MIKHVRKGSILYAYTLSDDWFATKQARSLEDFTLKSYEVTEVTSNEISYKKKGSSYTMKFETKHRGELELPQMVKGSSLSYNSVAYFFDNASKEQAEKIINDKINQERKAREQGYELSQINWLQLPVDLQRRVLEVIHSAVESN